MTLHLTSRQEMHYHLKVHVNRKSADQTITLVCLSMQGLIVCFGKKQLGDLKTCC